MPGIAADGIVGSQTRTALKPFGADPAAHAHSSSNSEEPASSTSDEQGAQLAADEDVDPRLGPALAAAKRIGLTLISGSWLSGQGWAEIRTSVTYQEHLDHVHLDAF